MLICIVLLYFCLMCSVIWLAFFPSGRQFVARRVAATGQRLDQSLARWQHQRSIDASRWRDATRDGGRRQLKFLRRHAWALAAGGAVVAVPTVLALMMRTPAMVPVYAASRALPDAQVAALLKGEQLVAPSTLPPMAFTTAEVELVRPMLVDASRNFGLLHPDFNQRLLMAFKIMREQHGYEMALLEGYRSPARQDLLASMGSQVSNARAFQSYHQYGLAADCAFWRDGKLVISEKDPWAMRGYRLYGEVAESLGLTWGGRWTMMDFGHTELRLRGVLGK